MVGILCFPRKAILALVMALGMNLAAQESKMALGLGPEWNMNSRFNFAGGGVLGFDYSFLPNLAAGLNFTVSSNFNNITVLEPAVFFRWYFLGKDRMRFFVQADTGAFFILEDGGLSPLFPLFDGGLRAGIRILMGERFYVEPYGRGGYPFAFGVGVMVGLRIGNEQPAEDFGSGILRR
jgi:hypothetical protein